MADEFNTVGVSRRIEAPAARIFEILCDPQRHTEFDGSDMLRGAESTDVITAVGDAFPMKMYLDRLGDYVMLNHVVEYEPDRLLVWTPAPRDLEASQGDTLAFGAPSGYKWGYTLSPDGPDATNVTEFFDCRAAPEEIQAATSNGKNWIDAMTESLAQLDALCSQAPQT
jgi:hypothetical protein